VKDNEFSIGIFNEQIQKFHGMAVVKPASVAGKITCMDLNRQIEFYGLNYYMMEDKILKMLFIQAIPNTCFIVYPYSFNALFLSDCFNNLIIGLCYFLS